ncbi:MAG: structural protein P5 [Candidatus Acidiferrales bacterium]
MSTKSDGSSWLLLLLGLLLLGGTGAAIYYAARGLRNNNPGNIKYNAANNWQGQTGQDSDGFVIFDTMQDGVRALALLLINYGAQGYDTVSSIISHFSATDQAAYISDVASDLSVDPNATLDMTSADTISNLVNAITLQENGFNPLTASTVSSGVSQAFNA